MINQSEFIFTRHEDPGHSWLEVSKRLLDELGITEKISSYSYRYGDTFYLEEDCDMEIFANAWKAKKPDSPLSIRNQYQESSFVRRLPSTWDEVFY